MKWACCHCASLPCSCLCCPYLSLLDYILAEYMQSLPQALAFLFKHPSAKCCMVDLQVRKPNIGHFIIGLQSGFPTLPKARHSDVCFKKKVAQDRETQEIAGVKCQAPKVCHIHMQNAWLTFRFPRSVGGLGMGSG